MAVDRPTFSESWYRVAALKPRLRTTLRTYRQNFRGQTHHVLEDPSNSGFFKLNEHTYQFVALLDGQRTVAQAWEIANETMGDMAPTQNEVIQVLSGLYQQNLLEARITPDVAGMFARYRKRRRAEVSQQVTNVLFLRIPLINPNRFLDKWVNVVGRIFTWPALVVWLGLVLFALTRVIGKGQAIIESAYSVLAPGNWLWLGLAYVVLKVLHEFGHAFACKWFGRHLPNRGEVHTMGIMLLVLMPIPYVDASASWSYRNKWHRAAIGAAGMYVEIFFASIAAVLWASTSPDTLANSLAYNVMFISSIATIAFNSNPLIRFDGYYILCDILELPNLMGNSQNYLKYLFKRWLFGVKRVHNPARSLTDRFWLFNYGIASTVYRVLLITGIALFVADQLPLIGAVLAIVTLFGFFVRPVLKFIGYVATSPELFRVRWRAVTATLLLLATAVTLVGGVPMADAGRAEAVVEPENFQYIRARSDGFLQKIMPSGQPVNEGILLAVSDNHELHYQRDRLVAERRELQVQQRLARLEELSTAQALTEQVGSIDERLADIEQKIEKLRVTAPFEGTWVSPRAEQLEGTFVRRGDEIGLLANLQQIKVRAAADQYLGPRLVEELKVGDSVEMRIRDRPNIWITGTVRQLKPAGDRQVIHGALTHAGGGQIANDPRDANLAAEPFFEIVIDLDLPEDESGDEDDVTEHLKAGQVLVVRFQTEPKLLAVQWYRAVRQLLQARFQI